MMSTLRSDESKSPSAAASSSQPERGMAFLRSGLSRMIVRTAWLSSIRITRASLGDRGSVYRRGMGFNPFRPGGRDMVDVAMVAGALAITVALVLWAIFG